MLKFILSEAFLRSAVVFTVPILFAALAALISDKAGIVNISIEGCMAVAALAGALTSHFTHSWAWGLLCSAAAGIGISLLLAFAALRLGTHSVLAGIALNAMAAGICIFALYSVLGVKGDSSAAPSVMIPDISIPVLDQIPVIGSPLFHQNLLFPVAVLSTAFVSFLLNKTRLGTHIKAVGYNEKAALSVGIRVNRIKVYALIMSGLFAGLGGAYLSMAYLSYFSAGMVSGRGFIGLAAAAMGGGMPALTLLFAFLFGAVDCFAVGAQAVLGIPYELLNTLPYGMTVLAMVVYSLIKTRSKERINAI
jgi:simple sugar transport system permease protein